MSVFSCSAVSEVVVSLAEFFSEDPSVAANTVITTVNSKKHTAMGRRLTHENIFMFVGVFSGKHLQQQR
jgi:hypothetical protein